VESVDAGADSHLVAFFQWTSRAAAAASVALGVAGLLGWAFNVPALKGALPGLTSMRPNSALGLVLIGVGLGLASWMDSPLHRSRAAEIVAWLITALGLVTLTEYATGWDLRIDQLLFRVPALALHASSPGRMSPTTAACFFVLGLALVCSGARRYRAAVLLSSLVAVTGMIAILGYLYGVASLYR